MKRTWLYIGVTLAAVILWVLLAYLPMARERSITMNKIKEAEARVEDFRATVLRLPKFIESQRHMNELRTALNSRLYTKAELLDLFDRIEKLANRQALRIVEISPPVEELLELNRHLTNEDHAHFLNLTITVQGSYVNFGKFAAIVEKAPYFRGINACSIRKTDNGPGVLATFGFRALLSGGDA